MEIFANRGTNILASSEGMPQSIRVTSLIISGDLSLSGEFSKRRALVAELYKGPTCCAESGSCMLDNVVVKVVCKLSCFKLIEML